MSTWLSIALVALAGVAVGCTATTNTPATPPTLAATTSSITPGSVVTTTSITTPMTTTVDRVAEITAIFQDLERRRLQAILDQDEEAFRSLYANEDFYRESLELFQLLEFEQNPTDPKVTIVEIMALQEDCATALVRTNLIGVTIGGGVAEKQQSIERVGDRWGISYVGSDWACDALHPFS